MNQSIGEETKICPRCGEQVLERRPICRHCGFRFLMSCQGCGREIVGRVFCPECIEPGIYSWQRIESAQPLQSDKNCAEKLLLKILIGRKEGVITC